jgi:hypothetical protein
VYGRGGWCDGQQVSPHVVDITSRLYSGSLPLPIVYNATNDGHAPNPAKGQGRTAYIDVNVFLSLWRQ